MEREIDKEKLALMDVLISRSEHGFKISLYRKPTFTELYLNFVLHQSKRKSKKRIVRSLQYRVNVMWRSRDI